MALVYRTTQLGGLTPPKTIAGQLPVRTGNCRYVPATSGTSAEHSLKSHRGVTYKKRDI